MTLAAFLFGLAGDGLRSYFIQDDMMNLYGAWFRPLESQRPTTVAFYDAIFFVFGLNPLPYHVALYAVLIANLVLLYWLCLRLCGSREVGALACLLGAYHAHLADVYYSADTACDLLCAFFLLGGLQYYLRVRELTGRPRWRDVAVVVSLYVCALNAKEMAVFLPVLVLVYEFLFWSRDSRTFRTLALLVLATLIDVAHLFIGTERKVNLEAFQPHLSWSKWVASWIHYGGDLFYGYITWTPARIVLLWLVLAAIAAVMKRRELWIALAWISAGILPIAFIAERGFYAYYEVLPGWYLYAAVLLWAAARRLRVPAYVAFTAVALILIPLHWKEKPKGSAWVSAETSAVRSVLSRLGEVAGPLPRGARVLFLKDPFPKDDWILTFMFRLYYRDNAITVDRAQSMKTPPQISTYDRVLRVEGVELRSVP